MADAEAVRGTGARGPVPESRVTTAPTPPSPDSGAPPPVVVRGDEGVMSLLDHLTELRSRLVRSVIAVAAGSVVGFLLAERILKILIAPVGHVQILGVGDGFFIYMKIAVVVGIILAMPVLLYQGWAFIAPGLTPAERRVVRPWVPIALAFFALGVVIAYVILPFAIGFLLS